MTYELPKTVPKREPDMVKVSISNRTYRETLLILPVKQANQLVEILSSAIQLEGSDYDTELKEAKDISNDNSRRIRCSIDLVPYDLVKQVQLCSAIGITVSDFQKGGGSNEKPPPM